MEFTITYTPCLFHHVLATRIWHTATRSWLYYARIAGMLVCAYFIFSAPGLFVRPLTLALAAIGMLLLFDGSTMLYAIWRWNKQLRYRLAHICHMSARSFDVTVESDKQQLRWQGCPGYWEEKDCFIIYTSDKGDYIAPPKALLGPQAQEQLRAWLATETTKFKKAIW